MKDLNIYMCGVGGQGIGLLAEAMLRACHKAGYDVKGVDTHGLAQRGGTVISHLRIGKKIHTPLIPSGKANIVIALERLEGARAASEMLIEGGKVIFYDAQYQTIGNRLGKFKYPTLDELEKSVKAKKGESVRVFEEELSDPRMQNIVIIKKMIELEWIPGLSVKIVSEALAELMHVKTLEKNLELIKQ
ncbi:MAG TPA: 2-oxoacid:acceptor oxidoreductase family protein [Clostridiales bacterium]|nr:2-oxoacid:acceptor oxidoreductase family protein [Clostridiales bacterium]HQP69625.1 2-oxoacid:acceptor oxidoreductase family protein [Clostridiales bacterium]